MLILLLVSYFYNLPVIKYSIKGSNELRLYDVLGPFLFFFYFKYLNIFNREVKQIVFLKRFYQFVIYCSISIILTLIFSVLKGRILYFVQSFLYLYHMWVFFLGAVFLFFALDSKKKYKRFVLIVALLIMAQGVLVILQHFGIVPFLWNEIYYRSYGGFKSGTLGPNKIVLGIFMLISFALAIGLYFLKTVKLPKYFFIVLFGIIGVTILLSGSRTTYVGVIVFLVYFMFNNTQKFLIFGIIAATLSILVAFAFPSLVGSIDDVLQNRVTYVIDEPEDLQRDQNYSEIYSELSTGRDRLHVKYVNYLLSNPQVLPVGKGFNNRMGVGNSAHNIYLTFLNELGIVGLIFYLRWLFSYLLISKKRIPGMQLALNGLVIAMLVTLYFGEHLYVYRPLFAILGYFLVATVFLLVPFKRLE